MKTLILFVNLYFIHCKGECVFNKFETKPQKFYTAFYWANRCTMHWTYCFEFVLDGKRTLIKL